MGDDLMAQVVLSSCTGCSHCVAACPTGAIQKDPPKVKINQELCVNCGICIKICPDKAMEQAILPPEERVSCTHCPVECQIAEGKLGACQRYTNQNGQVVLTRKVVFKDFSEPVVTAYNPLLTGVGAGTDYPDIRPAPFIVQKNIDGVDVVTVVTETPLTYSSLLVKIDTDEDIGKEGDLIIRKGCQIGRIETEQYGAKMLSIGGGNIFSGDNTLNAVMAAKTVAEIANGEKVKLRIKGGPGIEVQVGEPPVINGRKPDIMRVGCGSATTGMFAKHLKGLVDEAIFLDHLVTGLLSEHKAGEEVGFTYSGVVPVGNKSTRGRYFGEHGNGMGGTPITNPRDAIKSIDMSIAREGMTILVTDTTGSKAAMFRINKLGEPEEIPLTPEVKQVVKLISDNCEPARVSAMLMGGLGGSARAGVTSNPIKLTRGVHEGKIRVTVGGAPVYILPGGNITFMVDVEKLPPKAVTWVATPAPCVAAEYTMTRAVYEEIEGHIDKIKDLDDVLKHVPVEIIRES